MWYPNLIVLVIPIPFSKKQNCVSLSIVEYEDAAVGSCCSQILWIKHQLEDFGIALSKIHIKCDNTSVINISKNLIEHCKNKH